jgi:two-component system, OmpR family, alkaline phosphatase synthesis response regulator PhoP
MRIAQDPAYGVPWTPASYPERSPFVRGEQGNPEFSRIVRLSVSIVKSKGEAMQPVSSSPELVSGASKPASERRILIVDDEPFILKSLTFVLRKEGFHVDSASNGMEAKEKIQLQKPDIVFLDIMMPKMNGLEVCQWLRQDPVLKDTYVIILTAKGQEADREKGLKIGADEYMTKPFSPSHVVNRIKELFKS